MLQTLFSRCNITYFAETKHEEINNWKSNDYRREKRCHLTPFYFIRLPVIRLNSRAGKINRILSRLARISRGCPARKKISFDHEITLPLSSGSIKTQTFGSKKALEGKKRVLGFAYFSTGKIRTSSAGSPSTLSY